MGDLGDPRDRVLECLRRLDVSHEIIPIDPRWADTASFCERYGYPPGRSANTILVASRRDPVVFCACVLLATTRLDVNGRVRKLMGVPRASFATEDQMTALTGMQVGGVTAPGLPDGIPLYVDSRVTDLDWVVIGDGGRTSKIRVATGIFEAIGARIVTDLARVAPPSRSPARGA